MHIYKRLNFILVFEYMPRNGGCEWRYKTRRNSLITQVFSISLQHNQILQMFPINAQNFRLCIWEKDGNVYICILV